MNRNRTAWRLFYALLIALWVAAPAHAGYQDLKEEFDTYRPPRYIRPPVAAAGESVATGAKDPGADFDFQAAVNELRQRKTRWEKRLSQTGGEAFYPPGGKRWQALASFKDDPEKTAGILKKPYDLETIEILTLLRAPGVQAAEKNFKATLESFDQVLNLEAILRQYSAFAEGVMPGVGPMKGEAPIDKRFPFPGVLALKGDVASLEAKMAEEKLEIARRTAVTKARGIFWDLLYTQEAVAVTREMLALLTNLEAVAKTRYEAGNTNFQDVIKIRIQRETLEEDLVTLTEKGNNLKTGLKELLNLAPALSIAYPAPRTPAGPAPPLADLYDIARTHRQELALKRAGIAKMERMIQMSETMILPGYTLGTGYYAADEAVRAGAGAEGSAFAGVPSATRGAGLPKMPWYGKDDAYLRETRQKAEAMRKELEQLEADTAAMVRNAWFELDRAAREARLYRAQVVALSKTALEVSTRGYESGKVSFADVFGAYTNWLTASLNAERKTSDLGIAHAELASVLGTSPGRQ